MPKRGDNIHKRKDGRWEGRYKIGSYCDGRTKYKSVYGKTYSEVKEKLLQKYHKDNSTCKQNKESSFRDVLELWLLNGRLRRKGATEHKYRYLIETHINPELGDVRISKITAPMINAFLDHKLKEGKLNGKEGLSASYVTSMMLIIRSAINFAVQEEMCIPLKSPIHRPVIEKREFHVLDKEEHKRLEHFLIANVTPTKLGILLSLHTGLRIGEICALKWENVDLENGILRVRSTVSRVRPETPDCSATTILITDRPKTKASVRDIPISTDLLPYLVSVKEKAKSEYVIAEGPSFMKPRTYEYRFHQILKECDIASVNYHTLRHTFATRCVEAGVDVKSLSEILGHANVSVTLNTYVHSSMDMKRKQLEKLTRLSA